MTISVCTSTYNNTPEQLARAWASLKNQTHTEWQWCVYDDSTEPDTWNILWGFCADERYNIELYRPHVPSRGNIGLSKHNCFMLGKGDLLVELDADDELTPDALAKIQEYADKVPYSGFFYSDWCEINLLGFSCKYPDGWGLGYGDHYWDETHQVWAMRAPDINRTTLSHIVSAPNHVRVWRTDLYRKIGGHDVSMPVADDYELCLRTALATRMTHIPKMLYKQHIGPSTAQRERNDLIQLLVQRTHDRYLDELDDRFGANI